MQTKLLLDFIRALFEEPDPGRFQVTFLETLLRIRAIQRRSAWIRKGDRAKRNIAAASGQAGGKRFTFTARMKKLRIRKSGRIA